MWRRLDVVKVTAKMDDGLYLCGDTNLSREEFYEMIDDSMSTNTFIPFGEKYFLSSKHIVYILYGEEKIEEEKGCSKSRRMLNE